MITAIICFVFFYVFFGVLGLAFRLTFGLFKWLFLAALGIGSFVLMLFFAVPFIIVLPLFLVLLVLTFLAGLLFG